MFTNRRWLKYVTNTVAKVSSFCTFATKKVHVSKSQLLYFVQKNKFKKACYSSEKKVNA